MRFEKFLGRRVLICGEAGAGKTRLLAEFLRFLIDRGMGEDVTVIDLAPEHGDIGRSLRSYYPDILGLRYMRPPRIYPPRLLGRSREEVLRYAERNLLEARRLLDEFSREPSKILLIDDVTIYLHAGDPDDLLRVLGLCETFAATAYEGVLLQDDKGSGVTERERRGLWRIKSEMDFIVSL